MAMFRCMGKLLQPTDDKIYGASWDGSSSTAWTRTDDAVGISNPNPAVGNGTGSSPFDNIMPWAGMVRLTDSIAGELVAIPKYYYKLDYANETAPRGLKIQISAQRFAGSQVSPAHVDRGDGHGERDVVYVGRYHCANDYKSKTGVTPVNNITRSAARTNISNLGNNIWQLDYATYMTICMLYLVEFADWDVQNKIGFGCCTTSQVFDNSGLTDAMQYHTGTNKASRTEYGSVQYRNIEGLWHNAFDWIDGIRCEPSTKKVYYYKDPSEFSDTTGGIEIGSWTRENNADGIISTFFVSSEGVMFPSNVTGYDTSLYTTQYSGQPNGITVRFGAAHIQNRGYGLFNITYNTSETDTSVHTSCRLMILP